MGVVPFLCFVFSFSQVCVVLVVVGLIVVHQVLEEDFFCLPPRSTCPSGACDGAEQSVKEHV